MPFSRMRACIGLAAGLLLAVPSALADRALDHRDHYEMDSISGGAFRDYTSEHVTEDDRWARSMRTFGSFHNFMHELMSSMARYGRGERDEADLMPDFDQRISGGQWRDYRNALEAEAMARYPQPARVPGHRAG